MTPRPRRVGLRAPLGGCDCYLLALEDLMLRSGQGRHVGVTVLELGAGFDAARLSDAAGRFGESQPILGARLHRGFPGAVPEWRVVADSAVSVQCHEAGADWRTMAEDRLQGGWPGRLRFDVIPQESGKTVVLMSWSHLLLDARGVELALAEVARLGADAGAVAEADSHALPFARRRSWREEFSAVRPFLQRYWSLREHRVMAPGAAPARAGAARFALARFTAEETAAMKRRAEPLTGGIFALPWFLAVTMRAHAALFRARGLREGSLECTISVQGRKRGMRGPIFQNQVSQLFFALPLADVSSAEEAARALQGQFAAMTRQRFDEAFIIMVDWMRRLPAPLYRRFLRREASGQLASFYHAHTGEFLPGVRDFCGGLIMDGWHIPSVPQPPGTGLFFSERDGRLTASLCWREGVLSPAEQVAMLEILRDDLLGKG